MEIYVQGSLKPQPGCVQFPCGDYRISLSNLFHPSEVRVFKGSEDVSEQVLDEYHLVLNRFGAARPSVPMANAEGIRLMIEACSHPRIVQVRERQQEKGLSFVEAHKEVDAEIVASL